MNTTTQRLLIFLSLIAIYFASCKDYRRKKEIEKIVKEWVGKKILFPENVPCYGGGKDTLLDICNERFQKEFKILMYVDSAGCSSCRLNLFEWKQLLEEVDSLFQGKVGFLLFFQPKSARRMTHLFTQSRFSYPVFMDIKGEINRLNRFPKEMEYQCFLMDKDDKVVMIGNPALNLKIWELYKAQIAGGNNNLEKPLKKFTSIKVDKLTHELGCIKLGANYSAIFQLTNTGDNPLLIDRVTSSCGCVSVEWDKKPITIAETTDIRLNIKPDEVGYFSKTIIVHCNIKNMQLSLKLNGMVIN